jgi:hypothetical protein
MKAVAPEAPEADDAGGADIMLKKVEEDTCKQVQETGAR